MFKTITMGAALAVALVGCTKDTGHSGDTASNEAPAEAANQDKPAAAVAKAEPPAAPDTKEAATASVGAVTPDELEALMKEKKCAVFDANSTNTREKYGVIPGAKLLPSKDYDVGLLPEDKASKVVFYCSNTSCGSAPKGAERALAAGYTNVATMPQGISGWAKAGKSTEKAIN